MKGVTKIGTMADWTLEERAAKEKEWRQSLFTLRLQKATGQLDNPMKIKSLRRDIARMKTLESRSAPVPAGAAAGTPSGGGAPAAEAKAPTAAAGEKASPAAKKVAKASGKSASAAKPGATAKAKA